MGAAEDGQLARERAVSSVEVSMSIRVHYKTSLADLYDVSSGLFERMRETFRDVDWSLSWDEQPQDVRDGICILLAKVRNRTAPPVGWTPP
jgi:hypothetical protein